MRARATSTTRARAVGSSLTSRSATSPSPTSSMIRSVSAPTSIRPRRPQVLRISPSDPDVVPDGQGREQLEPLVGPRQAAPGPRRGSGLGDVVPVDHDPSGLRCQQPADNVEQRGLAGAIRADEPRHSRGRYRDGDVAEHLGPAEGQANLGDLKSGHRPPPRRPPARCRRAEGPGVPVPVRHRAHRERRCQRPRGGRLGRRAGAQGL